MQAQLLAQNQAISEAYASIERDLSQARALQRALLPDPVECSFGRMQAGFMLRSAGKVGGDMVGLFPAGPGRTGVYSLDVSGHGVASGLLSARAAGMFANLAAEPGHPGGAQPCRSLRQRDRGRDQHPAARRDRNRSLLHAVPSPWSRRTPAWWRLCRPGIRIRSCGAPDGAIELVGVGGLPVGLVPGASWQSVR